MNLSPLIVSPIVVFSITLIQHVLALRLFPHWKLLDFPHRYGLPRQPLPYPTGIIAPLVFALAYAVLSEWMMQTMGLLIGIVLLALFCFMDDRTSLSPLPRIMIQVIIALLIFATGSRIYTLTNPLSALANTDLIPLDQFDIITPLFGPLPVLSGLFTILWLGLTINALNWFDGIPGQVTTLSTIGFLTIGLLSLSERVNQPHLALLSLTLAGISLGCLLFDFPPPKVVLGDSGAMFFGLMLGVLTIYSGGKVATAFLVLGVPLIDFGIVILRRIWKRKSPLKGDRHDEHLHHRLLQKGWSERSVIALTASLGTLFGITALFLSTFQKFVAAVLLLLIMVGLSLYSKPASKLQIPE